MASLRIKNTKATVTIRREMTMILGKLEVTHAWKLKCSKGFGDWILEGFRILRSWTNIESNQITEVILKTPKNGNTPVSFLLLSTE